MHIDNSIREKHSAIIDCQLLRKIYINLLDQKEPKLNLNMNEDISTKLVSKEKTKTTSSRKVIKPTSKEFELHSQYLKSLLPKNFF